MFVASAHTDCGRAVSDLIRPAGALARRGASRKKLLDMLQTYTLKFIDDRLDFKAQASASTWPSTHVLSWYLGGVVKAHPTVVRPALYMLSGVNGISVLSYTRSSFARAARAFVPFCSLLRLRKLIHTKRAPLARNGTGRCTALFMSYEVRFCVCRGLFAFVCQCRCVLAAVFCRCKLYKLCILCRI